MPSRVVSLQVDERLVEAAGTSMVELMGDNADPKALDVYAALDMPFATLMGQVAGALAK